MHPQILALSAAIGLFMSCTQGVKPYQIDLPNHFPALIAPIDNELNSDRVALGQLLFFDKNLSLDSTISCQSCHVPALAFTDGRKISLGINDLPGKRNAPSLVNAGYLSLLNKDGGVRSLDIQALVPIEDENEMGISIVQLVKRLSEHRVYQEMAQKAYGDSISAFVITRALASFVRSLSGGSSSYDEYLLGDPNALSPMALKGLQLFESERLNCVSCHSGFNLTNNTFTNNGLYVQYRDIGRALISLDTNDIGSFRVPSLRNITLTKPYMHDGSLASLEEVLTHYESKGSSPTPRQSKELKSFTLNDGERLALLTFFDALTDQDLFLSLSSR